MVHAITAPPVDATHMFISSGHRRSGGYFRYEILFFKKEQKVWHIYDSDSDNEYPGWRKLVGNGNKWFVNNEVEDKLKPIPGQLRG